MAETLFNFSNGTMNMLCSNCSKVVKTAKDFTDNDWKIMEGSEVNNKSSLCEDCKGKVVEYDDIIGQKDKLGKFKDIIPLLSQNPEFKENLIKIVSEKMFNNLKK